MWYARSEHDCGRSVTSAAAATERSTSVDSLVSMGHFSATSLSAVSDGSPLGYEVGINKPCNTSTPCFVDTTSLAVPFIDSSQTVNVVGSVHPCKVQFCSMQHPSAGSVLHSESGCKPCHFFHSKGGCHSGTSCTYCHYNHSKNSCTTVPKWQRQYCQELIQVLRQAPSGSPERAVAEAKLFRLASDPSDSRYGAYVVKALSCWRGGASCRIVAGAHSDVDSLLCAVKQARQCRVGPNETGSTEIDNLVPTDCRASNEACTSREVFCL